MVGIVLVSHSRALAASLVDLVKQVSNTEIPIAFAAGTGTDREEFGTDAVEIMEAIQEVYSEDGVLVLMDLGSAILSAEMAVELLPSEITSHVRFCAAPVVEGAIAAGVQAGLGSDLETVCQEALTALVPKFEHISGNGDDLHAGVPVPGTAAGVEEVQEAGEEITLTLRNLHGLHARPAARFVQLAARYESVITVKNLSTGKGPVSAKSLNSLATLGAVRDHQILISASGPEAIPALEALKELVDDNFGEVPGEEVVSIQPEAALDDIPISDGALRAVPVSEGLAVGPLFRYRPPTPSIPQERITDPGQEWERFKQALEDTRAAIQQRSSELAATLSETESEIFDAHLLILQDPELLEGVRNLIFEEHMNAAAAWDEKIKSTADAYHSLDDPYLQQRSTDVLDVGNQLLFALANETTVQKIEFEAPVVLFAHELSPTETSQLDMSKVLGVITIGGGPTSHSAILARALGIPAVSGISAIMDKIQDGSNLALDGFEGQVWIDPSPKVTERIELQRKQWLERREKLLTASHEPAITQDGQHIEVVANVGSAADAEMALRNGAEGIGLLRTEFLYLTRESAPTEKEQIDSLQKIGDALHADNGNQKPIIVRTLDVGGDKDLPYIDLLQEENPFLGVRAIRLSLQNPGVFKTQLRAVLRAGENFNFKIMFPMVATFEEIISARQLLEETHQSLAQEGIPHRWPIETGIMVEIPATALLSNDLAPHVDFFSIGTNDLTQYTFAAERGNPRLSDFADALHPAVLRLIQTVVESAHKHERWVGVCGELAGDPVAAPILVGLGVDELSMNPGGIPKVKAIIRSLNMAEAQTLANMVCGFQSAQEVRTKGSDFLIELMGDGFL